MIDCKKIRDEMFEKLKPLVNCDKGLAIIQVGDNSASEIYVKNKVKDCALLGIPCVVYKFGDCYGFYQRRIQNLISELNEAPDIAGIIIQSPLPPMYDEEEIVNTVLNSKDVDGFKKTSGYTPATPKAVMKIIDSIGCDLAGKKVTLFGKGRTVGMPLIPLLLNRGVTLTVCGSKTKEEDLYDSCYDADVIISAVGKPGLINKEIYHIGENYTTGESVYDFDRLKNQVIIDVGISRVDGKQVGDVDKELWEYCPNCTGWTNSVGILTRACLIENLLKG